MNTIAERFEYARKQLGLSYRAIGELFEVTSDAVNKSIKRDSIKALYINTFSDKYGISKDWILKGEGEMKTENENSNLKRLTFSNDNIMNVPLVNQYAYGGYLNGFNDPEFIEELPKIPFIVEKEHKGEYICFEVKGDSMDNGTHESYLERDILLCRNVRKDFWESKLHINKWDFVIVHKDNGICVKRIIKHDVEKGIITCHSLNDYYEDFDMDLRDVTKIFNIVDIQRKRNRR
ncbi:phage repressor protein C with HTH and peptisase S24 domain [Flavobacterium chryseum]|uniref:S24 family peptidase n=1 Tax=Flavobacterium sp. P3160 TaxID=2512113 RepID=UPI00105B71E4|nr:S24 family peptidase [Flavobacterium sp. P3160]TDO67092.1 phage repressor protein C with HTH and peptisase S24 domain [Flavobacterium sp. P3160]